MEIRTWIASITEDGLNEVARKSRIAQRTLYNQLDKGHPTAENVIRIATTYNAHPFRALIDTGHIDAAWALVPDIRAALRLASEDDLGDEVLYRMKLGTSTLGDKTVDQLVEERADNVHHLPTPTPELPEDLLENWQDHAVADSSPDHDEEDTDFHD